MSDTPVIASPKGFYVELKAGKRYQWCACGRSRRQPWCDGSHAGTGFEPVTFRAERDEDAILCGCKHTGTPPFCDGTHNNLPGGYATDDPDSEANRAIAAVAAGAGPQVRLDGSCYVFSPQRATLQPRGVLRYCAAVSPAHGALFQSQFYAEIGNGVTPVISADGRHTVLFITAGAGTVTIGSRRFEVQARTGIYIAPDEAWSVHNPASAPMKLYISNGPGSEDLVFLEQMPPAFDDRHPERRALLDPAQRHKMAERYYQMLVSREQGSTVVTQFIGNIPESKAQPHRHLYEEALFFLAGSGVVWTETRKTAVGAGDVVFLPRKQLHSVQCTSGGGLDLVGVIYPGDNPSINY
ncbi:MAG: CDGSH iron-sulfur domain-containing protein [Proteobacteria bacterium]|nr:CDGSH iron-sulfur domain-containing protein [Pseudomonadota bacterium]